VLRKTKLIHIFSFLLTLFHSGIPYSEVIVGVPKETYKGEKRVALTPENVAAMKKKGFKAIRVERGAGLGAKFSDEDYVKSGASLSSAEEAFSSDVVLKVRAPHENGGKHEASMLKEKGTLISFLYPAQNKPVIDLLAQRKATVFGKQTTIIRSLTYL
jgi:NAD(P) transhydrogenase